MRTGRLSRLGHRAEIAGRLVLRSAPRAQAATLELIAHAMLISVHSLHCTDKCPMAGPAGRV